MTAEAEECDLGYSSPTKVRQDIEIYDCAVLPDASWMGTAMDCLIYNGSGEAVESIQYGIRLFEPGKAEPFLESGFEGRHRHGTATIPGNLQPKETFASLLPGPVIPRDVDLSRMVVSIEILSVRVPGSVMLR